MNPRYPIYIVSKGRWESRLTSRALEKMHVPYRIVIEPQEFDQYSEGIESTKILKLPFSNLGQGSIPARNWIWNHAINAGHKRHWVIDDNIREFYRQNKSDRIRVNDGAIFLAIEDFVDRYENVALAGPDYVFMGERAPARAAKIPFLNNTRIYSCILILNEIPYRWRGVYNEDTDLSLRVLKDGWCTIQFRAFLQGKQRTMTLPGGNTEELYQGDGRLKMAQSLQKQHPDLVKITWKYGRWQHQVNYRPFKANKLKLKPGIDLESLQPNEYGMKLIHLNAN